MFAYLGAIPIGLSPFTGPTSANEREKTAFAKINVAEGKPPLQDMGDDLATKRLKFFFDETFCDPLVELERLRAARAARQPMPWVAGDGTFTGARYVIEEIDGDIRKTTLSGRITRIDVQVSLIESPVENLESLQQSLAQAAAGALSGNIGLSVSVRVG